MIGRQGTHRALAAVLTTAAGLGAPAAAQAAEAHIEGAGGARTIVFTAAPGEANSVLVDRDPGFTDDLYQLEDQNNPVTAGPGCANKPRLPFSGVEEDIVRCQTAGVTSIRVVLGDGTDSVRFGDLNGNVIADTIDGGSGTDMLSASNGPTTVAGGDGDDQVDSRGGNDQVNGGGGNDSITLGQGSDAADGGSGNDKVLGYALPGTHEIGRVTKFRGGETNRLAGGSGNDTLEGDNGRDDLTGGAGSDRLNGGGDADVLRGGPGGDTLDEGDSAGNPTGEDMGAPIASDRIEGGSGRDTATYCTRQGATPLRISLDRKANDGRKGERDRIGPKGDVENVLGGGASSDRITGSRKANVLAGDCLSNFARSGNNKIFGLAGNDRVVGGDGNDLLSGGRGRDAFIGNDGRDNVQAKDGGRDRSINCDGTGGESGGDRATVDRRDPAARSCEIVKRRR